jgi:aspartyl-tRNA(Asn)/glutamyl-tRNA(Gln) amidotransferase subunit B
VKYEVVMGIEIHVELATESKLFCGCSAKFGAAANENVCPACAGLPGMPAVTNKRAVDLGIAAGIVTNSEIAQVISFDKKNYFYPDLPAGYQLTQWFAPICRNGWVEIETSGGKKRINLKQIHIEEDAGKLVHDYKRGVSLVDFNRTSVPLIEIVSMPDFRTAEEVVAYLEKLRSLLSFAGISDCKMQEGSMRCDVNISVREAGSPELGIRSEIKNMNSLRAISRAIEYESQRHIDALEYGSEVLIQETRRWDDNAGATFSMREKETAGDYRYFPNPENMPIYINNEWIDEVRKSLPESADEIYLRMTTEMSLSENEGKIVTRSKNLAYIFNETLKHYNNPKDVVNWIVVELLGIIKGESTTDDEIIIDCQKFAKLISLVDNKTINRTTGKELLIKVLKEEIDPESYVREHNLGMISDMSFLEKLVKEVVDEHEKSVQEYRDGNEEVLGFLVGQVMRRAGQKADPKSVNQILRKMLA